MSHTPNPKTSASQDESHPPRCLATKELTQMVLKMFPLLFPSYTVPTRPWFPLPFVASTISGHTWGFAMVTAKAAALCPPSISPLLYETPEPTKLQGTPSPQASHQQLLSFSPQQAPMILWPHLFSNRLCNNVFERGLLGFRVPDLSQDKQEILPQVEADGQGPLPNVPNSSICLG